MKIRVAVHSRVPAFANGSPALFQLRSGIFLLSPQTETWLKPRLERAGVEIERCSPEQSDFLTAQSRAAMLKIAV